VPPGPPLPGCGGGPDPRTYGPHRKTKGPMGSLIKKRRKKMSKHKYRKRLRADRHKRK
jgi:hypothetical protein